MRCFRTDTSGSAAVEFSMVAPITIALLFGSIDLGRFAAVQQSLRQGVTEAVQLGMVSSPASPAPQSASDLTTLVRGRMVMAPGSSVTVAVTYPGGNVRGGSVRVTASHVFNPGFGLLPIAPITINAVSQRRITD
jgi:hypothetical protein